MGRYRMFPRVGIFASLGVRKLISDDQWSLGYGCKGIQSALGVSLVLGSTSTPAAQGRAQQGFIHEKICQREQPRKGNRKYKVPEAETHLTLLRNRLY